MVETRKTCPYCGNEIKIEVHVTDVKLGHMIRIEVRKMNEILEWMERKI